VALHTEHQAVYARTKTRAPGLSPELIDRPRLLQQLAAAAAARVLVLQAPAGYGKTTLLQQWARQQASEGASVAWFTIDANDREAEGFLGYLIHALEEAGIPVSEEVRSIIRTEAVFSWKLLATLIANSFVDSPRSCLLVLDDAQHLKNSTALDCLQQMIDCAPPQLHFAVASREETGLPLGRLRAIGQCVEIRVEQMRFDSTEIESYVARSDQGSMSPEQLATLSARTEGWIAGLKLLCMSRGWQTRPEMPGPMVSGEQRELVDYFAEDVIARQPAEIRAFLQRTSVLDRLCPALCDSLPGVSGSRAMIDQCSASGLFLISLDQNRNWYRYHQLFADFLRRQLEDQHPGLGNTLRLAASRWFADAGFHPEAFEYALSGNDAIRAAEILDAQCDSMWMQGRQSTIQSLASRLPPHVQALYPRIMLAIAWRLAAQWKMDEARQLVAVSRARLEQLERGGAGPDELRALSQLLRHREAQIAHYLYQPDVIERTCREILANGGHGPDHYLQASTLLTLQYALREQFEFAEVPRLIEQSREAMERTGFSHGQIFQASMTGASHFLAGRTDEAIATLSRGLTIAVTLTGPGSALGAVVAVHLARIHFECNDIAAARELLDLYGARPVVGIVDQLVALHVTQSRLAWAQGDQEGAQRILESAMEFGDAHSLPLLRHVAGAELVRLLLRRGRPDDASRRARQLNIAAVTEPTAARRRMTLGDSALALAWCRLAAAEDRVPDALVLARRWRAHATTAGAMHTATEWGIAVTELLLLSGDRRAAQRALAQAIEQAAPGRFVRLFVEAGEPIAALIEPLARTDSVAADGVTGFTERLRQACRQEGNPGLETSTVAPASAGAVISGRLHTRELEILKLAGAGLLNKQISEKLGLTEGTVKWYLQQVFDKLGVRDRARAAAMAKQLGLIS
jgi:LuxR family transcriptional regulator, maltose regulon positive regulatory protein